MKKKLLLTLGALTLIVLCLLANAFLGNPLSKALATRAARARMAEHYPTYTLERVGYNFKDGDYYAHFTDPAQVDGAFTMAFDGLGRMHYDSYESRVLSGENTARRLSMAYRDMVDAVLEAPQAGLPLDFGFGDLEIWSREASLHDDCPAYALITEDLLPNGVYDVRALGAQAGHLVYYLQEEQPSLERLAHWLLEIRRLMDEAGVPFVDIDLTLRYLPDKDLKRPHSDLYILHFPYEEIYEEGLLARVEQANADAIAYYAGLDAQKQ